MESSISRRNAQEFGEKENIPISGHQICGASYTDFNHELNSASHEQEYNPFQTSSWPENPLRRHQGRYNEVESFLLSDETNELQHTGSHVRTEETVLKEATSYGQEWVPSATSYLSESDQRRQPIPNVAVKDLFRLDEANDIEGTASSAKSEENAFSLPSFATCFGSRKNALADYSDSELNRFERDINNEQQEKNDAEQYVFPAEETDQFDLTGNVDRPEENHFILPPVGTFFGHQQKPLTADSFSKCDERVEECSSQDPLNANSSHEKIEKLHKCEICLKRFCYWSELKRHERVHSGEKPFECETCKKRFNHKSNLNAHVLIHTGERPFVCDICEKNFISKGNLKLHQLVHTGEKRYECETCKKKFSQKSTLRKHVLIHTGYVCDMCTEKFRYKSDLDAHKYVHTGHNPYECRTCKKTFSRKQFLSTHVRIHTGEKSYECETCKKKFSRKCNLKTHVLIHNGERPFVCETAKKPLHGKVI